MGAAIVHAPPRSWIRPRRILLSRGVRSCVVADFQLVCGAGPYELDLLVREKNTPYGLELAGQVTRAGSIHDPVGDLLLSLVTAEEMADVCRTVTDGFGEFDLASGRKARYGLRLGEAADAPCVLVWEEDS